MELLQTIKVNSEWTKVPREAIQWLREIKGPVACDFEAALKYTEVQRLIMEKDYEEIKDDESQFFKAKELFSKLKASALSHPSHVKITHFSFAESEDTGKVIVIDNARMARLVLHWLITTDVKQIWHNASFDFKHIQYHTGTVPKNFEDTQIASKCLLNHVEVHKANTGLKELMGRHYGSWSVSSDNFTLEKIYDEDLIHYAAVDACATYKLWNEIQDHVDTSHGAVL